MRFEREAMTPAWLDLLDYATLVPLSPERDRISGTVEFDER
jgi:hypothetical protein